MTPRTLLPSVSILIRSTFSLLALQARPVVIGLVCFAVLGSVIFTIPERKIERIEDTLSTELGITWQKLRQNVEADYRTLSALTPEQLAYEIDHLQVGASAKDSKHISLIYTINIVPYLLLMVLIMSVLLSIVITYVLLLFTGPRSGYEAAVLLPFAFGRMVLLSLWVSIRSLTWIPFFGLLLGLYTIPRLILSPVFLLRGNVSAFTATRESWAKTKGMWLPVLFRLLLLCLLCLVLLWLLTIPVGIAALFSLKLASLLWMMVLFFLASVFAAGVTVMTR